jgi:hypothetical protein
MRIDKRRAGTAEPSASRRRTKEAAASRDIKISPLPFPHNARVA